MSTSQQEVELWKGKRLADHRQAYQKHLLTRTDTSDTTNTTACGETMEVEREISDSEVRLGGHVTSYLAEDSGHVIHSDITDEKDKRSGHMAHGDVLSSSHVTYCELIENTEIPQLIYNVRTKVNSHLTTFKPVH